LDPAYDEHNELELLRERSVFCQYADVSSHMAATLRCAQDDRASARHRLQSARQCAIVAEMRSPATLGTLLALVQQLPQETDDMIRDAVLVELYYNQRVGDLRAAVRNSAKLIRLARHAEPSKMCYALNAHAMSLTLSGYIPDARRAYYEAVSLGKRLGVVQALATSFDYLIGVSLDFDSPGITRATLDDAWKTSGHLGVAGESMNADLILPSHEAQLAVMVGDIEGAMRWAIPESKCLTLDVPRWKARLVAIHASVALQSGDFANAARLAHQMASCFEEIDYWLDWPASVYAECLAHENPEKASEFAAHFIRSVRRELYPVPEGCGSLVRLASQLGFDGVADRVRVGGLRHAGSAIVHG
jgi:hypothetical protein